MFMLIIAHEMGIGIIMYIIFSSGMVYISAGLTACCNVVNTGSVTKVNYIGCHLQTVPDDIPLNTTELDLRNNNLTVLHKDSFKYLRQLDKLLISSNQLSIISYGSFNGLQNLTYLDLSNNILEHYSFNILTFQPLLHLKHLDLRQNSFHINKRYPEHALSFLSQLEILQINVFDGFRFGIGFLNLTKLKQIDLPDISGQMISIRNSTFRGLERAVITHLVLYFPMKRFELNALAPFHNLVSLTVNSMRTMNIRDILSLLHGLQNRNMEYLALTGNNYIFTRGIFLVKSDLVYLRTICVRRVDLTHNAIEGINMAAVSSWSNRTCLERVDISSNNIQYYQLISFLVFFPSLTHIDASNQRPTALGKRSLGFFGERTYFLPNSLIYINISRVSFRRIGLKFVNMTFHENNNLQILDISYPLLHVSCSYGSVKGLVRLKELYMSGFECSNPNPEMIAFMPQLSRLAANQCNLGNELANNKTIMFKGRNNLTTLDLSENNINVLGTNIFADQQHSLKILILTSNKLVNLQTHILRELQALEFLDLSHNLIPTLTTSDMTYLDEQGTKSSTFKLNLHGNPLVCSCDVLSFLAWVGTTNILYNKDDLLCRTQDGSRIKVMTFLQTFDKFQESCDSQFWLITSLVLLITLLFTIVLSRVFWTYSVNLRVWCRQPIENEVFPFDVFVCYCKDDTSWVARSLVPWLEQENIEYCIDEKTFDPGVDLCDNIMNAIDNSRKSVFVVSCNYFENEWQTFAMKLTAVYSFRDGREDMNIIILLNDMQRSEFPKLIRKRWEYIRPISWPKDHSSDESKLSRARGVFWKTLLKRIKHGSRNFDEENHPESTV